MIKHCPTCNRTSDKTRFIGEFCEFCVTDRLRKHVPDIIKLSYCKRCGRIRIPGRHSEIDRMSLMSAIKMQLPKIKMESEVLSYDEKSANIEFMVAVPGGFAKFTKDIGLKMKHEICKDCLRKSSGYFEATVQLRGDAEVIQRVMRKLTTFLEERDAFVAKAEKVQGGWDIYTSDKRLTNVFFRLHELNPKKSYTLFTVREGKPVYRDTYAIRV